MRIYWLNPPISTRTIVADTAWMNFSAGCPEYEWIPPIIDWEPFKTADDVVNEIVKHNPDVLCLSSYIWNGKLCLEIAEKVKQKLNVVIIRGGPHQPYFTQDSWNDYPYLDYACNPLGTGEPFMHALLNQLKEYGYVINKEAIPSLMMRGYTALVGKQRYTFPESSSFEHNIEYLTNVAGTARTLNKNSVINMETTRGCPYECTYCEWGGGIGTKVSQKPTEVIYKELDLVAMLGFGNIDFVDANFGILKRDPEIMQRIADNKKIYGVPKEVLVYGVAKVKIEKREAFLDVAFKNGLMSHYSLSVQSYSQTALDNVKRTDVSVEENLALARKFYEKYGKYGKLEIILGLPGYTLEDFYKEMDFTLETAVWDWCRGPLTILPGTEMATPFYRSLHKIKTSNIGVTENDNNDITYKSDCVLTKYKSPQEVVVETYSFTRDEWVEMFFMNYAQKVIGPTLTERPSIGMKKFYDSIQNEEWFVYLKTEFHKLANNNRSEEDFLLYDGHLIEDWVTKFYINKEPFHGSYN